MAPGESTCQGRPVRQILFVTVVVSAFLAGCNRPQTQTADATAPAGNPADGNLAPADQSTYQANYPANYPAQATPSAAYSPEPEAAAPEYVEASEPPPPLPDYEQPPAPGDDYIWTPGYWAY